MKKLFLAISSMIVTGFLMKSYRKLREKSEVYEDHLKIERRRADARTTFNRMDAISTPMDDSLIDSLLQMSRGGSHENIPGHVLFKATLESGLTPCKGSWVGAPDQVRNAAKKLDLSVKEYSAELMKHRKDV